MLIGLAVSAACAIVPAVLTFVAAERKNKHERDMGRDKQEAERRKAEKVGDA